jgi:hypothetical protein
MEFYYKFQVLEWSIHLIPIIDFFIETCESEKVRNLLSDDVDMCAFYLNVTWLKWSLKVGYHKKS